MPVSLVAVLLALPAGAGEEPAGPRTVERAIEDGVAWLRASYEEELRDRHATRLPGVPVPERARAGERALLAYTLLEGGVEPSDGLVRQMVAELAFERIEHTYDIACTLLLLEQHDAYAHRAWIEELVGQLQDAQEEAGDWGYPAGGDLSNTQYAALGLWAASRAGVDSPPAVWRALAEGLEPYRESDGAFCYQPRVTRHGTGSMTAAGVATLALCEMELARLGALEPDLGAALRARRGAGLAWLGRAFRADQNPRSSSWTHYWLYGVERMAAFGGLARVGDHDWYAEGERWLLDTQRENGNWQGREETCFAILFLVRASLHSLAPLTGPDAYRARHASPTAAVQIEARPVGERTALRVVRFGQRVGAQLEWPGEHGQGPHVLRVEYREGERVLAVALGDDAHPARGQSFPATVRLTRGTHRIRARALAAAPGARGATPERGAPDPLPLESQEVVVEVARGLPSARDGPDPGRRISFRPGPRAAGVQAHASSVLRSLGVLPDVEFDAFQVVDGKRRTPWVAREDDATPELELSFRRSVRVDRIGIVQASLPGFPADELGRALEVELVLNGRATRRVLLLPDPSSAATVALDEPVDLHALTVRVLSSTPGHRTAAVGLGEIELALESER